MSGVTISVGDSDAVNLDRGAGRDVKHSIQRAAVDERHAAAFLLPGDNSNIVVAQDLSASNANQRVVVVNITSVKYGDLTGIRGDPRVECLAVLAKPRLEDPSQVGL